ncbi:hypothetical protein Hamer_G022356 [Homarus americanus]|uniref:Uncharacterized protein n=1 Tax=Homarus americanus TaxID=6706 RepID=A0A8J5JF25_HOMAM|nr:hypothetical protein Hamer_G022356 [Homarus americanus]
MYPGDGGRGGRDEEREEEGYGVGRWLERERGRDRSLKGGWGLSTR